MHGHAHSFAPERESDRTPHAVPGTSDQRNASTKLHRFVLGEENDRRELREIRSRGAHAESIVLPGEPLSRHAHHAKAATSVLRAMPVGAAAWNQAKMLDQSEQPHRTLGRMAWVAHFESIDSLIDECGHPLARSALCRMRENGQAAGPVNQLDGVGYRQPLLGDIGGPTIPE